MSNRPRFMTSLLSFLSTTSPQLPCLKRAHALLTISGFTFSRPISRRLIALYCLRSIDDSILFFFFLRYPDQLASNLVIKFLVRQYKPAQVLSFFSQHVHSIDIRPNKCTFPLLITSAKICKSINHGELLHCLAVKTGFMFHVEIQNALIHMYALCDTADYARQVFDEMPERDVISFNSMISGYVKNGDISNAEALFQIIPDGTMISWSTLFKGYVKNRLFKKGLWFFNQMVLMGLEPDDHSIVTLLSILANFKMVPHGKIVHAFILKRWVKIPTHVKTTLLDFYLKCGLTKSSTLLFETTETKDLFFYNTFISGLVTLGFGKKTLEYFPKMQRDGIKPDETTFSSLLIACGHSGLVEEALSYFHIMISEYNIKPTFAHHWCLVDILIKADRSEDAMKILRNMPWDTHSSLWNALVVFARETGDNKIGEYLGRKLIELEPDNVSRYVPLVNIYVAASKWDKYWELVSAMKERKFHKVVNDKVLDLDLDLDLKRSFCDEDELNLNVGFG